MDGRATLTTVISSTMTKKARLAASKAARLEVAGRTRSGSAGAGPSTPPVVTGPSCAALRKTNKGLGPDGAQMARQLRRRPGAHLRSEKALLDPAGSTPRAR